LLGKTADLAAVAAIEAIAKAGEQVSLSDLAGAMKKDKAAAQTAQAAQPGKTGTRQNAAANGRKQTAAQKSARSMAQSQKAWDHSITIDYN
jgi:hypothetical protein